MTVGVKVWYGGEKLAVDLFYLFVPLYISQVLPITFLSNYFTLKYFLH